MTVRFEQTFVDSVIEHMNADHSDAILLYVHHYGNLRQAENAKLIDLDRHGMVIEVQSPQSTRKRIEFTEALIDESEIRPVLVKMAQAARKANV